MSFGERSVSDYFGRVLRVPCSTVASSSVRGHRPNYHRAISCQRGHPQPNSTVASVLFRSRQPSLASIIFIQASHDTLVEVDSLSADFNILQPSFASSDKFLLVGFLFCLKSIASLSTSELCSSYANFGLSFCF